jgi:hypothetical protein
MTGSSDPIQFSRKMGSTAAGASNELDAANELDAMSARNSIFCLIMRIL